MAFEFDFTEEKLAKVIPRNKHAADWYEAMVNQLPQFEVVTLNRVAAFVAQCSHESADFTTLVENLNYSAQSLVKIFPTHFHGDADQYNRQPEKIANRIYCDRMGNGNEASGDGWKFKGRGPIQITGRSNYTKFANDFFEDPDTLINDPDLVTDDIPTSLYSALWFWNKNNLNKLADSGDIKAMTKIINGGYLGLDERVAQYNKAIAVFSS
jgi:putative chitinase